jgi:hypothetical protein
MNDANFKPSLHVDKFIPEDYSLDSERFLVFLRAYYEWLQTTKITLTGISGTFVRDEVVTGTDGGIGIIKEIKTGYIVVQMTSRLPFNRAETITGGTSNATATISTIKDNVVRASGNLQNYKNFELSIDKYIGYLQDELYPSLPATIYGNKRLLASKFKQFFETRSNEESYRFLFRLLYNEDVEFYYPGEDVLRISDGNFEKTQILRAEFTDDIFDFLNKTIRGLTSGALANVIDVKVFNLGGLEVAEMTLSLVSGTFVGGETIIDIEDDDLTTTLYGMITGFIINDAGSGYVVGDEVVISGDGSSAQVFVSSIQDSPITSIKVNEIGHGYRLNTNAVINNSGTGGSGLLVRVTELANTYSYTDANTSTTYTLGEIATVQILNRGSEYIKAPTITLQDTTISALGLLSDKLISIANAGIDYGVGNTLVFTGGSGSNAAGQIASVVESTTYDLLFEDNFRMLSEDSYDDIIKNEDWDVLGPIARIELTNFGDGYETANLPSIAVTTTTGSGANLVATNIQGKSANVEVDVANNATGIGSIRALEIKNLGVNYTTATADLSASGDGNANLTPVITGLGIGSGNWVDDDGKINFKFIQDSFFYQDFSYVIKSGLTFNFYKDTIKKIIHPAGLQPFGEILLFNEINLEPNVVVEIEVQKILDFIVQIFSLIDVSFTASDTTINRALEIELDAQTVSGIDFNEYVITKLSFAQADSAYATTELRTIIELPENLEINTHQEYIISISPEGTATPTGPTGGYEQVFYKDVQLLIFASNTISDISGNTFNDIFSLGPTGTTTNVKIVGNVTISGTNVLGNGTSFISDFVASDSIIIDNSEKFIINSISNNTFMTINVPATGSYSGADAYKERRI